MQLSSLQKFILLESYGPSSKLGTNREKKVNRRVFSRFYNGKPIDKELKVKIISKSLERLINKGLLVGYGERTKNKWYIKDVCLTLAGRRLAKKLMGVQTVLPFKK